MESLFVRECFHTPENRILQINSKTFDKIILPFSKYYADEKTNYSQYSFFGWVSKFILNTVNCSCV